MARKRKLPEGMTCRPGRRGYYADFRVGGRRVQKKLGTVFDAAKSNLNELRARAERAEFGLLDNDCPIADLRDKYLKRCEQELKAGSVRFYRHLLSGILDWMGVAKVSQLTTARVLAYRDHRLAAVTPGMVNKNVDRLRAMLAWGVKHSLIGSNPLEHVTPLRHDRRKEGRALTDDEVGRLLQASWQPWRDMWYAYLVTGVREMELAGLRFTDVDWEARELIVRGYQAKNHRERRVPVEDALFAILKRQAQAVATRKPGTLRATWHKFRVAERFSREHVFVTTANTPCSQGGLYVAFMRCCKRAGIQTRTHDGEGRLVEHVDIHSLRRTFATNAIVNGADPKSVQEVLGHRTLEMTMKIYAKVKGASKRQAVARLSYATGATPPDHVLPLAATGT
jgi:integrase